MSGLFPVSRLVASHVSAPPVFLCSPVLWVCLPLFPPEMVQAADSPVAEGRGSPSWAGISARLRTSVGRPPGQMYILLLIWPSSLLFYLWTYGMWRCLCASANKQHIYNNKHCYCQSNWHCRHGPNLMSFHCPKKSKLWCHQVLLKEAPLPSTNRVRREQWTRPRGFCPIPSLHVLHLTQVRKQSVPPRGWGKKYGQR